MTAPGGSRRITLLSVQLPLQSRRLQRTLFIADANLSHRTTKTSKAEMTMDTKMTGGCMCGSVRYETTGEPFAINHCHCESCRKHNGAAVVTLAGIRIDQVQFTGNERKRYGSSPGAFRAFCDNCGTPLTWEGDGGDLGQIIEFHISTFDDPERMVPYFARFRA